MFNNKHIRFNYLIIFIFLSCETPISPSEIETYSVHYAGNGNTDGEIPGDSTTYEERSLVIIKDFRSITQTGYLFNVYDEIISLSYIEDQ